MKKIYIGVCIALLLAAFVVGYARIGATQTTDTCTDVTTVVVGDKIGNVCSSAAFTAGAGSTIDGYVNAYADVTLGSLCKVVGIGNVSSGAAFTSGDGCVVKGSVSAKAGYTSGANSTVDGNVTVGADYTSGAKSIVKGNVFVAGDVTLGAGSKITGSVHSGTGVITYGDGATVGSVK